MPAFVDTNVLFYAFTDDRRRDAAQRTVAEPFMISTQVLNEFANSARRKLKLDWPTINLRLLSIRAQSAAIHPVTLETHALGLHFAERYHLSVYDGMVVAACWLANCETLWTEDMHDGLVIEGRLTIRNPFA